jgi:hypothetical protein
MAADKSKQMEVKLKMEEEDFGAAAPQIRGIAAGRKMLNKDEGVVRAVQDALPSAIARRVSSIIPAGFVVKEIEFKVSVEGKPFGIGVGGDVTVKMGPASVSSSNTST